MSARPLPLTRLLRSLAGPAIWFLHLTLLYGAQTVACLSPATAGTVMAWSAAAVTLAALGALGAFAAFEARRRAAPDTRHDVDFLRSAALLLALLSGLGVIWNAIPVAALPACGASPG
jgi:hypothetical protein